LFVGLAGIPRIPSTALALVQVWLPTPTGLTAILYTVAFYLVFGLFAVIGYLFAQGGTVLAVSELYLGRATSAAESLRRVADDALSLLGVVILNGLAVSIGFIFLIVPGVYLTCRLIACVPAAIIEKKGPSESLSRSYRLTEGFAGRAFVVLLFSWVVAFGIGLLVVLPFTFLIASNRNDLQTVRAWSSVQTVISSFAGILLTPIILIATSIFYYDLRVRKEAFDLQVMMDPEGANIPRTDLRSVVPEQ
jgi:hypothetical protein